MKVPETYEEFLKTNDEDLIKISYQKKTLEEAQRLIAFANRAITDFKEKRKLISEEKLKNAKNNWERYCE